MMPAQCDSHVTVRIDAHQQRQCHHIQPAPNIKKPRMACGVFHLWPAVPDDDQACASAACMRASSWA